MGKHLTVDQIRAWMSDELTDDLQVEVIENHLSDCEQCAELMSNMEGDKFAERVRAIMTDEETRDVDAAVAVTAPLRVESSMPDRNLYFGMTALNSSMITSEQFVEGCALWMGNREQGLDEILVSQGWLSADQKETIGSILDQRSSADTRVGGDSEVTRDTSQGGRSDDSDMIRPLNAKRISLTEVHSQGGIGRVWLARDQVLNRDIAFKELLPQRAGSKTNRARFFREAQITAQLTHPGVVPVHDYVDEDGRHFYTMRFVKGKTLTEVIAQHHSPEKKAEAGHHGLLRMMNYFVSICQTIAYAHSKNIIHRDLKGDNVIIGDFGEVVVLDWGLAKRCEESGVSSQTVFAGLDPNDIQTLQGERLGTPAFMAPEQAEGRLDLIDFRTDVYGLASILYEILTGDPPFTGKSITRVLADVVGTVPESPRSRNPEVPPGLEAICMRGLEKEQSKRQQSVEVLTRDVENWIVDLADRKRTDQMRERFFGLSLDLLAILDRKGHFLESNPAWKSVLGWENDELRSKSVFDVIDESEHRSLRQNLEGLEHGQPFVSIQHRCTAKGGAKKWISWNANLLADEQSIYIVGRDISDIKRAQQRSIKLLESAPDAMVVVDRARSIRLVNSQAEMLFGYRRDELLGKLIELLLPERFRKSHPERFAQFLQNPETRPMGSGIKLFGRRIDGSEFPVEISLSLVETDDEPLISSAIRDISDRE